MSVEMAMWRMTDGGPEPLAAAMLGAESRLEDLVVRDPSLVGLEVLVLGRQVQTDHGGFVDVLAVDMDGAVHVLELKRDRTPRDVIAQALDYGSWVDGLGVADLEAIHSRYNNGRTLAEDFAERFGQSMPDTLNDVHQMTVVASSLDPASDRIVEYLAQRHGVPINAVFFRYFADGDREYLARTWLLDPADISTGASPSTAGKKKRPWNGRDFSTVQGTSEDGVERWEFARVACTTASRNTDRRAGVSVEAAIAAVSSVGRSRGSTRKGDCGAGRTCGTRPDGQGCGPVPRR